MSSRFDSVPWQFTEKLSRLPEHLYRRAQQQAPAFLGLRYGTHQAKDPVPAEAVLLCQGETSRMSLPEKLTAFCHAVSAGAHILAGSLAPDVRDALASQRGGSQRRAAKTLALHYAATGASDEAATLRQNYRRLFTSSRTIDPRTVSSQIDSKGLGSEEIGHMLWRRRAEVLRNPQLHLLAHRSLRETEPEKAAAALNRYLRSQGSYRITDLGGPEHNLGNIQIAPALPTFGGPLVSVLMSAYNAASTVEAAVRSILSQSYRNLELIICDDDSNDGTQDLLVAKFSCQNRVTLLRSAENQGTYNIRNALISRARGDLITVQDADDLSLPRRIEYQVRQLRMPRYRASVANLLRMNATGRIEFFHDARANRMAIVTLMASKEVFALMGPYRAVAFGADFEFVERLKARLGSRAVGRIRTPQLLCSWAEKSATLQPLAQALASGYRSPARRLYCDLVYRQRILGCQRLSDQAIDAELQASGNQRAPSSLLPLT